MTPRPGGGASATPATIEREAPRWGVHVPQFRVGITKMTALAVHADEAGVDNFWLMDHLVTPGAAESDVFEGWTLLTALATATTRIRLGLLVGCNPFRHPAVLAKTAATVDHISGGGSNWASAGAPSSRNSPPSASEPRHACGGPRNSTRASTSSS